MAYIRLHGAGVCLSFKKPVKDSISYISVARDSLAQDSLDRQIFSFSPLKGQMGEMTKQFAAHTEEKSVDGQFRHYGDDLPFSLEQTDGIFILILICFLFFTHIYNGGISFLKENISLLFSSDRSNRIRKQTTTKEVLYGYFLLFQAVILISICLCDAFIEYDPTEVAAPPFFTIITFILFIGLFLGVKNFMYKIIGYIFDQQRLMNAWRQVSVISIEVLGVLYFIPTLLLIYSSYYHSEILLFMLMLFIIIQVTLFYQIIIFFVNQKFNFLYLIAYLCTIEILPYIFLSTGLIYLYRTDVFNILWL
jgi:hypothetical protein